ncbi:MAG: hypothetical protein WD844_13170 [Thermoleophilaceae bacterium]
MSRRPDTTSLVAGIAIMALGTLLLLDRMDDLDLGFGWFLPLLAATVGVILLVSGLASRGDDR